MAGPMDSLIDQTGPKRLARAITAPSSLLVAGGAASVGIVTGLPIVLGLGLGVLAWFAKTAFSVNRLRNRKPRAVPIDPFRVGEPWRQYVQSAQQAQIRFQRSIAQTGKGPLQERLKQIGTRVDDSVRECFDVAQRGYALDNAVNELDLRNIRKELTSAEQELASNQDASRTAALESTLASIRSRLGSAERMAGVTQSTKDRLRQLNAQLDELVARAIELSISATSADDLGTLGTDVESVVHEMEALRQAMEETSRASRSGTTGGGQLAMPG